MNDLVTEALNRLDRIEQILREMGYCDTCPYAHERGVANCIESGLIKVERSLDRALADTERSMNRLATSEVAVPEKTNSRPFWQFWK